MTRLEVSARRFDGEEMTYQCPSCGAVCAIDLGGDCRYLCYQCDHLVYLKGTGRRIAWLPSEEAWLAEQYPTGDTDDICRILQRSLYSIYGKVNQLGLAKTPEFMEAQLRQLGKNLAAKELGNRFPKGHRPANKGKKMDRSKITPAMRSTWFKPGHGAENRLPIGTVRRRRHFGRTEYQHIKVADPDQWELLHVHLYTKAHGPVPPGQIIYFLDGNQMNCTLENLGTMTRAENARRNQYHHLPEELKETIRLTNKINQIIRKKSKRNA